MSVSEYVTLGLPATPAAYLGSPIFKWVDLPPTVVQSTTESKDSKPFSFSKALHGIKSEAGASSTERGDGKFSDGSCLMQQGNYVQLAPGALDPENAERTLQQLDALSATRTKAAAPSASTSKQSFKAPPCTRFRSVYEEAAGVLYDLGDDDPPLGPVQAAGPQGGQAGASSSSAEAPRQEVAPAYELTEVPSGSGSSRRWELHVHLPGVASAGDAVVDIGSRKVEVHVPGTYRLQVDLPAAVNTSDAKARWSKAQQRLSLTLPAL